MTTGRIGKSSDRRDLSAAETTRRRTAREPSAGLFLSLLTAQVPLLGERRSPPEPDDDREGSLVPEPAQRGPLHGPPARPMAIGERRNGNGNGNGNGNSNGNGRGDSDCDTSDDVASLAEPSAGTQAVKRVRRAVFRDHPSRHDAMAELMRLIALLYGRSKGPARALRIVPPAPNPLRLTLTLEADGESLCVLARSDLDATRRQEVLQALNVLESLLREKLAPLEVHVSLLA